jgi:hypothetical protein
MTKTISHWRKKSIKILENGRTFHAYEFSESMLGNGYAMKSNLYSQWNPHQNSNGSSWNRKLAPKNNLEPQMTSNSQNNSEQKRTNLEVSHYLTLNYTAEP